MTSDGTNTYKWDAENRLIQIDYVGANNYSQFSIDGWGRNSKIVETTSGSVTSTKQFVWSWDRLRQHKLCEERDGSGSLVKRFFERGQENGSTNYFYSTDQLGSIREMSDDTGAVKAQYLYDPYGRQKTISEVVPADFRYAGYYCHGRSLLDLTLSRAYAANLGRWINRDSVEEAEGPNMFSYVDNSPTNFIDPSGRNAIAIGVGGGLIIIAAGMIILGTWPGSTMIPRQVPKFEIRGNNWKDCTENCDNIRKALRRHLLCHLGPEDKIRVNNAINLAWAACILTCFEIFGGPGGWPFGSR